MIIIAIDLGKFNSIVCFFDSARNEYRFQLIKTERGYLWTLLTKHVSDLVVMEACTASGWVSDLCDELKLQRLVCSTQEEAWRWRSVKRKTDKADALKLARLAAMGQLKATHVPSPSMREYRGLIKYRKKLLGTDNRSKNSIRADTPSGVSPLYDNDRFNDFSLATECPMAKVLDEGNFKRGPFVGRMPAHVHPPVR